MAPPRHSEEEVRLDDEKAWSSEGGDHDLESRLLDERVQKTAEQKRSYRRYWPWLAHAASITTCLLILFYTKYSINHSASNCLEETHAYSPVLKAFDEGVRMEDSTIHASLIKKPGPWTGPPTPETAKAWDTLTAYGALRVSAIDLTRTNHSVDSAQYPPSAGGGYAAITLGSHHLHCLHHLWMDHYIDSLPEMQAERDEEPLFYEKHYEHCVDYLRQQLMCKYDTGFIPFAWVQSMQHPTPNFNTPAKCVNWDSLQGWLEDKQPKTPEGFEWSQPEGAVRLEHDP